MSVFSLRPLGQAERSSRRLRVEPLEDRRLLDAAAGTEASAADLSGRDEWWAQPAAATSPWQNPLYRLDVNRDGKASPADALSIINRLLESGAGPLPDPGGVPTAYYDTNGNNGVSSLDVLNVFNGLLNPPKVKVTSLTPFTIDVTPQVMINASSTVAIPDGTSLLLDVDLNNDGNFNGAGELGHSTSTLFNGSSTFDVTPALERKDVTYNVNLRARLQDADGVVGTSTVFPLLVDTLSSDLLQTFTHAFDPAYHYSVANTVTGDGYTFYAIDMTSQTWRSAADVDKPVWRHWVEVIVPTNLTSHTALMQITGGDNDNFDSPPTGPDLNLLKMAKDTHSVVVKLRQIPSEPLEFTDEVNNPRDEDQIIAYTFDKFMDHLGEPGNDTWPLLLPMVKSAVRAMDSVQDLIPQEVNGGHVDDFVVTGYSKRAWTTWLTAAADDRVKATIPAVFDNLDLSSQMVHHYAFNGFFSEAVQDYNDMQIFDRILTQGGLELSRIVDPYRYLADPRFGTMPKLILNSAGDEYFVPDSSQFYIHDLPGTQNYLRYLPNTGHGLDARANDSTLTFYDALLNNKPLPKYSWTAEQDGSIHLHTDTAPSAVRLWKATNPDVRDFRHEWNLDLNWTASLLNSQGNGNYVADVPMPASGATAYFIEMTFPNSPGGASDISYVFTTEARVKSKLPFVAWPYESSLPIGSPTVHEDDSAIATGLAMSDLTRPNSTSLALAAFTFPSPGAVWADPDTGTKLLVLSAASHFAARSSEEAISDDSLSAGAVDELAASDSLLADELSPALLELAV